MAITLDAVPKSATANAYATLAEAETYHESHVDASGTWAGATDPEKNIAIAMATRLLDAKYRWAGYATDEDQILQWPRTGLLDYIEINTLDADTYPLQLKHATSEQARLLLGGDTTADLAQSVAGLTGLKVGSVDLKFKAAMADSKPIPDSVASLIPSWWGRLMGAGFARPLVRA